jgi:ADP-heptose:LPS heptosyltransferase
VNARTLERWAKRRLSQLLVWLLRPKLATPGDVRSAHVTQLLVIRQHNQMGDMVLVLPALAALRRAFGAARLTFVAGPLCDELLQGHPDVDHLIVYRSQEMLRPWKLWRFVRRLRALEPQLAIVLGTVSFSVTSALLAWVSGAPLRVGVSSHPFGSDLSGALYNVEITPSKEPAHEVEHNLRFVRALGIHAVAGWPSLAAADFALAAAEAFLSREFPENHGPVVVAHVGAGKASNLWPVERFARVAAALVRQLGARVVVTEGPRDHAVVSKFRHLVPQSARWHTDLRRTLGILAHADVYVGNDTGMSHVAAAVGAPCIVVIGADDAQRWSPAGPSVRSISPESGNIEDLQVAPVLDAVTRMLESARHAR